MAKARSRNKGRNGAAAAEPKAAAAEKKQEAPVEERGGEDVKKEDASIEEEVEVEQEITEAPPDATSIAPVGAARNLPGAGVPGVVFMPGGLPLKPGRAPTSRRLDIHLKHREAVALNALMDGFDAMAVAEGAPVLGTRQLAIRHLLNCIADHLERLEAGDGGGERGGEAA